MSRPRRIVVTGAASGIGQATAQRLRAQGADVISVDLAGCDINGDQATPDGRAATLNAITHRCSDGLDAIIACAGISSMIGAKVVAINYFGTIGIVDGVRPLLAAGRDPRAVVISSSASILATDPTLVDLCLSGDETAACQAAPDDERAYSSSKLATTRWVRRASVSPGWADSGILLNGISPGIVRTAMTEALLSSAEGLAYLAQHTPRGVTYVATADDVSLFLAFLASAENRYLVGQVIFCDGGTDVLLRGHSVV